MSGSKFRSNLVRLAHKTVQNQKGISTLILIIIIIVVAVVAVGGVFAYQYFATKTQPVVQTQQNQNIENKAPIIKGISIEKPNLVVTGQNLSKVQIHFVPTGTGIDPETTRGFDAIKQSEKNGAQVWIYQYPNDLLITNIFAKGFDSKGNLIGKVNLPIAGASALADALYGNINNQTAGWKTYTNAKFGFEIKYPSSWFYNEFTWNENINGIAFCPSDAYSKNNCADVPMMNTPEAPIFINTVNKPITLSSLILVEEKYRETYNEMLSTFKFTK